MNVGMSLFRVAGSGTHNQCSIDDITLKTTGIENVRAVRLTRIDAIFHFALGQRFERGCHPIRSAVWQQREAGHVEFTLRIAPQTPNALFVYVEFDQIECRRWNQINAMHR